MFTQITLFGKNIPTYSLAAAVGIIAAVFYTKKRVREDYFQDLDRYLELELVSALAGAAIGAKLLYLLIEYRNIVKDIDLFGLGKTVYAYLVGGFVFYGGMLGCVAGIYIFCKASKVSYTHSLQLVLPMIPLAHFFGRLGCFVTGCCFGKETHSIMHVIYRHSLFAPNGIPLVPVQLIEAVLELVLFFVMHNASEKRVSGDIMLCSYFVLYGIGRFLIEFYRGDEYRGFIGVLSVSQLISLACIAGGVAYLIKIRKMKGLEQ